MKVICTFSLCFIINSTYGRGIDIGFHSTNESEPISPTWADFQIRHIVGSDQGSAANWNAYFHRQMPSQYGSKSVNTFIVTSPGSISKIFPPGVPQTSSVTLHKFSEFSVYFQLVQYTGGTASNLYWCSTPQRQFVLTLTGGSSPNYNVYDCGQQYFVAGLDMTTRLPVHYQGHSSTQGPRIDQITAGCTKVAIGQDFFSQDVLIFLAFLLSFIVVLSIFVLFKKLRGRCNSAAINEHSPLIN